jgi:hypothetical protein
MYLVVEAFINGIARFFVVVDHEGSEWVNQ